MADYTNDLAALQSYIAEELNKAEYLQDLGLVVYPENAKDIEFQITNALQKQGMSIIVMTPQASYRGHDGVNVVLDVNGLEVMVTENVIINRAKNKVKYASGLDVAKFIVDYLGGPQAAIGHGKMVPVGIDQGEDSGFLVSKATFNTHIFSDDVDGSYDEGDDGVVRINPFVHREELSNYYTKSEIDSKLSGETSLSNYYTKSEIDSKGYLTSIPDNYSTKSDVSSIVWNDYLTVSGDVVPGHWDVTPSKYNIVTEDDYLIYPTYNGEQCGNTKAMDSRQKTYIWGESEAIEPITATYVPGYATRKEKYAEKTYVDGFIQTWTFTMTDGSTKTLSVLAKE